MYIVVCGSGNVAKYASADGFGHIDALRHCIIADYDVFTCAPRKRKEVHVDFLANISNSCELLQTSRNLSKLSANGREGRYSID